MDVALALQINVFAFSFLKGKKNILTIAWVSKEHKKTHLFIFKSIEQKCNIWGISVSVQSSESCWSLSMVLILSHLCGCCFRLLSHCLRWRTCTMYMQIFILRFPCFVLISGSRSWCEREHPVFARTLGSAAHTTRVSPSVDEWRKTNLSIGQCRRTPWPFHGKKQIVK